MGHISLSDSTWNCEVFEDVDGAKNGSFKSHTVEVSIKDTYFGREEIRVKLEERESDE